MHRVSEQPVAHESARVLDNARFQIDSGSAQHIAKPISLSNDSESWVRFGIEKYRVIARVAKIYPLAQTQRPDRLLYARIYARPQGIQLVEGYLDGCRPLSRFPPPVHQPLQQIMARRAIPVPG